MRRVFIYTKIAYMHAVSSSQRERHAGEAVLGELEGHAALAEARRPRDVKLAPPGARRVLHTLRLAGRRLARQHEPRVDAARPCGAESGHARARAVGRRARSSLPRCGRASLRLVEWLVCDLVEDDDRNLEGGRDLLEPRRELLDVARALLCARRRVRLWVRLPCAEECACLLYTSPSPRD